MEPGAGQPRRRPQLADTFACLAARWPTRGRRATHLLASSKRPPLPLGHQILIMNMSAMMVMLLLPPSLQKLAWMLMKTMNSTMVMITSAQIYIMIIGTNGGGTVRPRRRTLRLPRRTPKDLRGHRVADSARKRQPSRRSGDGPWPTMPTRATMRSMRGASGRTIAAGNRMSPQRPEKTMPEDHFVKSMPQIVTLPMSLTMLKLPPTMLMMTVVIRSAGGAVTNIMGKRNNVAFVITDFFVEDSPRFRMLVTPLMKPMTMVTAISIGAAMTITYKMNLVQVMVKEYIRKNAPQSRTLPARPTKAMKKQVTMTAEDVTDLKGERYTIPLLILSSEPKVTVLAMTTDATLGIMDKMITIPRAERETSASQPGIISPALRIGMHVKSMKGPVLPGKSKPLRPAAR